MYQQELFSKLIFANYFSVEYVLEVREWDTITLYVKKGLLMENNLSLEFTNLQSIIEDCVFYE